MPMPPCHPAAGGGHRRPSTAPSSVSPTPTGGVTATRPQQAFEGHHQQVRQSTGLEVLQKSDHEVRRKTIRPVRDRLRLIL
jgi:hypothetical protein